MLKVGDYVEIIDTFQVCNRHLIGKHGVIRETLGALAKLTPDAGGKGTCHLFEHLRKIDPPDFSAPLTTNEEIEA